MLSLRNNSWSWNWNICVVIFVNTVVLTVHCDCQYYNKQHVYVLLVRFAKNIGLIKFIGVPMNQTLKKTLSALNECCVLSTCIKYMLCVWHLTSQYLPPKSFIFLNVLILLLKFSILLSLQKRQFLMGHKLPLSSNIPTTVDSEEFLVLLLRKL